VVLVDIKIPPRSDRQIKRSMSRYQLQHMIEKPNARGDFRFAAAVQFQAQSDVRLFRDPMN
jgi:hypothetical protein